MKVDFDTIIYLVITVAILVISGLGSRRKKKLQQTNAPASPAAEPEPRNAFEQLRDRFMTDLYEQGKMETSAPQMTEEDLFGNQKEIVTGRQSRVESMEGESLEEPVDEEEAILEEIRRRREDPETHTSPETTRTKPIEILKEEIPQITGLFEGVDEIKKAIIYSEVLKRKF